MFMNMGNQEEEQFLVIEQMPRTHPWDSQWQNDYVLAGGFYV